jgi:hypothetical protein
MEGKMEGRKRRKKGKGKRKRKKMGPERLRFPYG